MPYPQFSSGSSGLAAASETAWVHTGRPSRANQSSFISTLITQNGPESPGFWPESLDDQFTLWHNRR